MDRGRTKKEGGKETNKDGDGERYHDTPYCSGTKPVGKQSRVNSGSRVQMGRTCVGCLGAVTNLRNTDLKKKKKKKTD